MEKERGKYLRKARKVQVYNVIYDTIEVVVSLIAGFSSGSAALIGWGLDSIIEVVSASTLWWRLNGEVKGISEKRVRKRERATLYVIAISFLLVSAFITYDSISKLIAQNPPSWSTAGIVILVISLVVNPILIWYKYRYGKKLDSKELIADSKDTFVCLYQTIAVLGGLLAVRYLDWWWADPVAAFLIVPYALKEGWEAFQNGRKIDV
ncbi:MULTISPECIES: cation diffusion facilitator family transporter [Croceimicrobium]|uniref:Cation transporter n=1 Tax=Croceimicrobium hydrocarbonivorans TaxID=2761580 RepID=A0A7H0VBU0_9FLAO|nr:cation transporter [Croceimicrobium hydrocarbonivorans]QNR23188.1 cation transporter [Croceimicrobium hydrocarbonivorans]|tara:strand:+ start:626 stop:1249 length:624 start_codon:yes stop_codon:yes gene_type:complete